MSLGTPENSAIQKLYIIIIIKQTACRRVCVHFFSPEILQAGAVTGLNFSFVLKPENCVCQQWNAMNGMGCKGEVDQTRKAGPFLRLHHSTWKKLYFQFFRISEANAV